MHRPEILPHRNAVGGNIVKAAVVPAIGSSWQIKDVPQPQPGPNQVLVQMHASGICYTDVHLTLGHFPGLFPRILGHEPVGEIIAVAPDVTTRKVGDRVGTAWRPPGFHPPAGAANGASAVAECSVPTCRVQEYRRKAGTPNTCR